MVPQRRCDSSILSATRKVAQRAHRARMLAIALTRATTALRTARRDDRPELARAAVGCERGAIAGPGVPPVRTAHSSPRSLALVGQGALALACASLALVTSPARAADAPTRADVQRAIRQLVDAGAPGVTAVIRGPRGVERYAAGLANVRRGTPISPRDHFRIGSVTKSFVATVVLQLVAEDRLSLTD